MNTTTINNLDALNAELKEIDGIDQSALSLSEQSDLLARRILLSVQVLETVRAGRNDTKISRAELDALKAEIALLEEEGRVYDDEVLGRSVQGHSSLS